MLSVDHSNIDGPPLAVKCVRKFVSTLGEVTCVHACVRTRKSIFHLSACTKMGKVDLHACSVPSFEGKAYANTNFFFRPIKMKKKAYV